MKSHQNAHVLPELTDTKLRKARDSGIYAAVESRGGLWYRLKELTTTDDPDHMQELLEQLRVVIAKRFAAEERMDGAHPRVVALAPHMAAHIRDMQAQHLAIIGQLDRLCATFDGTQPRRGVGALLATVDIHEAREDELFQDALMLDLGGAG
jgi:hypothetical protein